MPKIKARTLDLVYFLISIQADEPEGALHPDTEPVLVPAEPPLDVGVVVHPYDLGVALHLAEGYVLNYVRKCMSALITRRR